MKKKSSHRKEILVLHPTDSTGEILQKPRQLALLLHTQAEAAAVPGEGGQSHELQPRRGGSEALLWAPWGRGDHAVGQTRPGRSAASSTER